MKTESTKEFFEKQIIPEMEGYSEKAKTIACAYLYLHTKLESIAILYGIETCNKVNIDKYIDMFDLEGSLENVLNIMDSVGALMELDAKEISKDVYEKDPFDGILNKKDSINDNNR